MSARLFGAALGLGTGGKRSPRASDSTGPGQGTASARMVTPRLRIVRPSGKSEGDSKGRGGVSASKLVVRREGKPVAPGDERVSGLEPAGSAPSRLKVTRAPSAALHDSSAPGTANGQGSSRPANREPRPEPEPGEVTERPASQAGRTRREQPAVRDRPAVESGHAAAARAQSVGLFSLAKMRSSSGPRKVRGRGETTTREQRLGTADDDAVSSHLMGQPPTRTLRLQVRRETAAAPSDHEPAVVEIRSSAKRSAASEQLGRSLSPSNDSTSPTAKKPRSMVAAVPDRSGSKESRKRPQTGNDLKSAHSAIKPAHSAANDDQASQLKAKSDDNSKTGRDSSRHSQQADNSTSSTRESSSNRQRTKRHRTSDDGIDTDGAEDTPLFPTDAPLFPTGPAEELSSSGASRSRKKSSMDKRVMLDRTLDSKMRSRLTLRTERARESEADAAKWRRESRESDRDRRQLDRELEEMKTGTAEMDTDRTSRREVETQSHRWRSTERSRWPGEDDARRSSGSPTDDRWMPHDDLDDHHRRCETSHRSSREHDSKSTGSRSRRSDRHTSPTRDEDRRPSTSDRHSDRDHESSRGSRSHRRSRTRSRSRSRSRRSHRKSSKDDSTKTSSKKSSRSGKKSRERHENKDAERRASSSPVEKPREEPAEEAVVFGCSERPEQSGDEDDILAQIHADTSPQQSRSPSDDTDVRDSVERSSKSPRTSPIRSERRTTPVQSERKASPIQSERKTSPVQSERRTSPVQSERKTSPVQSERTHKREQERDRDSERVGTENQRHERRGAESASWRSNQYEIVEESNLRVILPKDQATNGATDGDEGQQEEKEIEDDRPICKFFASARGCLRGDRCWFQHVLPNKTPRDKDSVALKVDGQRQTEQLDKELDELPTTTSNAAVASGSGVANAAASNGRPTSSPSPNGSPRWAEYSDWQGYDYYDSNESCGIVGSMVLNAVSSSDEDEDENEVAKQDHRTESTASNLRKPAAQLANKATNPNGTLSATTTTSDSSVPAPEHTSPAEVVPALTLDVESMRVPELRKALASKGLATTGKKAELVVRLRGADPA